MFSAIMTASPATPALPTPDTHATPALTRVARGLCAALALATITAVFWMILAGPRGRSGAVYVALLALQVATAVLFAFLAAYRPAPDQATTFGAAALAAVSVHAVTLVLLLTRADTAPAGLTRFRLALLALAAATGVTVAMLRDRRAVHALLLQLAHRAIALALWLLIAQIVIAAWGRPLPAAVYLLPTAAALLAAALVSAITTLATIRRSPEAAASAESRHLIPVSSILLAAILLWLTCAAFIP